MDNRVSTTLRRCGRCRPRQVLSVLSLALVLGLSGCMTHRFRDQGRALEADGRLEEAVAVLEKGVRENPNDVELRAQFFRLRERLIQTLLSQAEKERAEGRLVNAQALVDRSIGLDAQNPRARMMQAGLQSAQRAAERLDEAQRRFGRGELQQAEALTRSVLAEDSANISARRLLDRIDETNAQRRAASRPSPEGPLAKRVSIEFRDAPLRAVFEVLARTSGLNFVFDRDVRPDGRVTVFVRDSTIEDVLRLVLTTNQLDRRVLNANTVLIYPAVATKQREYQELVTRSFFLANSEVKKAESLVKQVARSRDVFIDEKLNLMVVKDTPEAMRLIERLIETLDVADPEVMLEVEVLEVSRSRLLELGLRFPDQIAYGRLNQPQQVLIRPDNSSVTTTGSPTVADGVINLRNTGSLLPYVLNPALALNLRNLDGDARILANPRIRVKNREKAKVHIGDRLPVFTTTATANVGISASVNYLDVGLKLDVEPVVHIEDEVAIKIGLEVSSIVREIQGPNNSLAYQIGTRNATTALRLRDGETQVLAGLISDEERASANRLPGFGDLPAVGRLFSNQRDSRSQTEIVLLITPRVVRNVQRPSASALMLPAGTDAAIGSTALAIGPTQAFGVEVRGSPSVIALSGPAAANPQASSPAPAATTGLGSAAAGGGASAVAAGWPVVSAQASTQAPTQASTQAPTQASTQAPTQAPTQASTQAPSPAPLSGQAEAEAPRAIVLLAGPSQVSAGESFSIQVQVQAGGAINGGLLEIRFDENVFEGPAGGRLQIPIPPVDRNASYDLRLKAKAQAVGQGFIAVQSAVLRVGQRDAQIELAAPLTIRLMP